MALLQQMEPPTTCKVKQLTLEFEGENVWYFENVV
jgi:hypothetical protein